MWKLFLFTLIQIFILVISASFCFAEYNNLNSSDAKIETSGDNYKIKGHNTQVNLKIKKTTKGSITLQWDPSPTPGLAGYKVYYDTNPGTPYNPKSEDYVKEGAPPLLVSKDTTILTLHGLNPDKDYYFSATAYKSNPIRESAYANEISLAKSTTGKVRKASPDALSGESKSLTANRAAGPSMPPGTKIRPGDVIYVGIPNQKEMSKFYDIDPDGYLYLDLIGKIHIDGLDKAALQKILEEKLRHLIFSKQQPFVKLISRMRFVLIKGALRYPGWYRVPRKTTLEELIEKAGGLLQHADFLNSSLQRKINHTVKTISVVELKETIQLEPSDIVFIPLPDKLKAITDSGDLLHMSIPTGIDRAEATSAHDFRERQIEVDRFGYIHTNKFGTMYVNGLTTEEIGKTITRKLPRYISKSSQVRVTILEKRHYIQVLGHVRKPGWYNIEEAANVQTALNMAEGAIDGAIMSEIKIQRKRKQEVESLMLNLYQYNVSGDERLMLPLHANDTIFVPISASFGHIKRTLGTWDPPDTKLEEDTANKVRIFGAVRVPGVYEPSENMDLLDLLVFAKGESGGADMTKIQLIRGETVSTLNLKKILEDETIKPPLIKPGDTIRIPFFESYDDISTSTEQKAFIIGAVGRPGPHQAKKGMNLLDILNQAQGESGSADLSDIKIIRHDKIEKFNFEEFLRSKNKSIDMLPKIYAGDTVHVPFKIDLDDILANHIFVIGKVGKTGQFPLLDGMTLLQALALAGGLDEWADKDRITIVRTKSGKQKNIVFSYDKCIEGKYPELNIRLKPNDVIVVP